jgi:hypothetical protein
LNIDDLKQKMIKSPYWNSLEKVAMEVVSFLVFMVLAGLPGNNWLMPTSEY